MSLAQISERTGLNKSTILRLNSVLIENRFLFRDPLSKDYRLDVGLFEVARRVGFDGRLAALSMPYLEKLTSFTQESSGVFVRVGDSRMCIAQFESSSDLRFSSTEGMRYPLHRGASGKILLAFATADARAGILSQVFADEGHDGSERDELLEELERVTHRGYARSDGEVTPGARSLAMPVRGRSGLVIGALNVAGPTVRFSVDGAVIAFMESLARELSVEMGLSDTSSR